MSAFRGDRFFLSNFSPSPVTCWGITFPTAEHAYQACKVRPDRHAERVRNFIAHLPTAAEAKRFGRTVALPGDWPETRVGHMDRVLERKFRIVPLRKLLIATGDEPLVEDNEWGDTFWGMCNGRGANILGNLLMKHRELLQAGVL